MWNNNPYFLQFFKNSGRISVNTPRKNLTHRGGTTFGVLVIMFGVIPQLITRVAESEDYDPTPTPKISKLPTPTPDFNFDYDSDSDSLLWEKYFS